MLTDVYPVPFLCMQNRRMIRLAVAAKQRERQLVREVQKAKRNETKEVLKNDVTDDVFDTPGVEKPVEIELEAPPPKVLKRSRLTELRRKTRLKRKGLR